MHDNPNVAERWVCMIILMWQRGGVHDNPNVTERWCA